MKRLAVTAFSLLLALGWGLPAQANPPVREVINVHDTFTSDVCGFPTQDVADGKIIRTTYSDRNGNVTRLHEAYPNYRVVVTNLSTGEAYKVAIPGPLRITFHPDGSQTIVGTGPWEWGNNPDTGEPGIFILKGRWVLEVDSSGEAFSYVGTFIDVCARLA